METTEERINVEVIYATPTEQELVTVAISPGQTVRQAIEQSQILQKYPEIDLNSNKVGIFSKMTTLDTPLRDRDRIEIYRPLIADPKEVRRKKAAEKRA
ncbi:MAG: RnfH family protein [Gammaproteobacteria bacterium]|nr:RnfH family protein [Gammaproteobacteria bacterium]